LYLEEDIMSDELVIREYKKEDWPFVKIILLESDIYAEYGPSVLKSEKNRIIFYSQVPEKGKVFVAVLPIDSIQEGKEGTSDESDTANKECIVGYSVLDFFGRGVFILSLNIGKQFRNQGHGRYLLNFIKDFARKDPQYTILRGFADERLTDVHVFLIKQGFRACGFVEHDLSFNHSTIHYFLPLREEEEPDQDILISA
jgi:GNAT superfamily N-acetyltransferase